MTKMTFSSEKITCKKAEIGVKMEGQSQLLSVFTVPMIYEPLSQPLPESSPKERTL